MINSQYSQCPSNTLTPPSKQTNSKQDYSSLTSPALSFNSPFTQTAGKPKQIEDRKYIMTQPVLWRVTLNCKILSKQKLSDLDISDFLVLSHWQRTVLFFYNLVKISLLWFSHPCHGHSHWWQYGHSKHHLIRQHGVTLLLYNTWECRTVLT